MEWYFTEVAFVSTKAASMFGTFQLIVMAAVYIFKFDLVKPKRS